ncbi:MAG: AI-2E family transporter, partial [Deltaproteobacteria bacterium]|nr:AI-2E family transporter [Deltaproteobacteria bacterium]
ALLAVIFYPFNRALTQLLGGRRGLASTVLTTLVIGLVIVPTITLTVLAANESVTLYQSSNEFVASGGVQRIIAEVQASRARHLWDLIAPWVADWNIDPGTLAVTVANTVSAFLVAQATGIAKNVAGFIGDFFLCTFALFFFFRDGERMVSSFRDLLPMEAVHKDLILERFYEALSAVVQGTLVTAVAQGSLAGLGYWILGVPLAVFLGCATALISLVPYGTAVAWGAAALYLYFVGEAVRAVILIVWGTVVVGTVDNLLRPLIIGGRTEIPTLILFFGILGGLQAYGFFGLFLAPAVIATLVAFLRIYQQQYAAVSVGSRADGDQSRE